MLSTYAGNQIHQPLTHMGEIYHYSVLQLQSSKKILNKFTRKWDWGLQKNEVKESDRHRNTDDGDIISYSNLHNSQTNVKKYENHSKLEKSVTEVAVIKNNY